MEYALADIWESISREFPERKCLVNGENRISWREFDRRAGGVASSLKSAGLKAESKVALYLYNSNEYLESTFAALKFSAVPVNVNYRYLASELEYLLDNADAEALIFHHELKSQVTDLKARLPKLKILIEVGKADNDTETTDYEDCAAMSPLPHQEHSPDDLILLYTGGTTGMPKGVMHRTGTLSLPFRRSGIEPKALDTLEDILEEAGRPGHQLTFVVPPPLMHGVGWWSSMMCLTRGGCVVTLPGRRFDPDAVWRAIETHQATNLAIVGDAFAAPMADAFEAAAKAGKAYDISRLTEVNSSGSIWSAKNKRRFLAMADLCLLDAMGASEGGTARQITRRGDAVETSEFVLNPNAKVFTDDDREVPPGSGEIGMLATSQNVPLGYYKDPEKTRKTFRIVNGVRYSFPGDYATIEADGTVKLLGRGSMCINSAGEKIYPGEVEEALKADERVSDCAVVGVPDDKYGQIVAAVVHLRGAGSTSEGELLEWARQKLASYKLPKIICFTPSIARAPNGKVDYAHAKETVLNFMAAQR